MSPRKQTSETRANERTGFDSLWRRIYPPSPFVIGVIMLVLGNALTVVPMTWWLAPARSDAVSTADPDATEPEAETGLTEAGGASAELNATTELPPSGVLLFVVCGVALLTHFAGLGTLAHWARNGSAPESGAPGDIERDRYGRHLTTIGLYMFSVTAFAVVGLGGMFWNGRFPPLGEVANDQQSLAGWLMLACGMSVVGALFFVADAVRKKRARVPDAEPADNASDAPPHEAFDEHRFWGGLFVRMGEAIVFTLVAFLAILARRQNGQGFGESSDGRWIVLLPLMGLLFGMFIKPAERVIFGAAEKIFDAVASLFPGSDRRSDRASRSADRNASSEGSNRNRGSDDK